MHIPVLHEVDIFIAGAGSGAVAAALAARRAGRRVAVASDLTYFGEECAGALRVQPSRSSEHALFRKLFPSEPAAPRTPLQLKHVLETELLDAGIPFLYGVRPVALLKSESGEAMGVVLAARTSLYAIVCGALVDATRQGLLARLAGVPRTPRGAATSALEWNVLATEAPKPECPEHYTCEEIGALFGRIPTPRGEVETQAFRLRFSPVPDGRSIPARAAIEHQIKSRLFDPHVIYAADLALIPALDRAQGRQIRPWMRLDEEDFRVRPGFFLLNGWLPLDEEGLAALEESAAQIELGHRVGLLAAESVRGEHTVGRFTLDSGGNEARGPFLFAPSFVRPAEDLRRIEVVFESAPVIGDCDVVVAGGGTGGAPAGIGAARAGARAVVLEALHGLGGVGTLGFIANYHFGNRVGFTREIDEGVAKGQAFTTDRMGSAWSPELKNAWYQRALLEAGGTAWFGSYAFGVYRQNDRVTGLLVSTPFGSGLLRAGAVVDASGNADIAAAAGAPVRWVTSRHVAVQGAGLSPRTLGQRYSNTDHTFADDSDPVGVTAAFAAARAKFPDQFDAATIVNSRERRQILGEIELSPLDFLARRTFPDTVTIAYSNFDTHGFTVHPVFLCVPPDKEGLYAHVPFRCLLPRGVEGLIVIGLGMSAHRDALPVVRMQADIQNHGYAAGLAAAWASCKSVRLRDVDIRALQRRLVEAGILPPEVLEQGDSFPLPPETVRASAQQGPTTLYHAAVIFAHPEISAPVLMETLQKDEDPQRRERAALALGLMGRPEVTEPLAQIVRSRGWDEGWNFRGMGQFGFSTSRMDALLIALGRAAAAANDGAARTATLAAIREKIEALDENAAFSHVRAVAVAASILGDARLAEPLTRLLQRPGMSGHAQTDMAQTVRTISPERNETHSRNHALRELYLGRAIYLCGDPEGIGRRVLETYARDLRGPFARHAAAVLAERDLDALRRESI